MVYMCTRARVCVCTYMQKPFYFFVIYPSYSEFSAVSGNSVARNLYEYGDEVRDGCR